MDCCITLTRVEIHPSARSHGVLDEDITHAYAHQMMTLFLGDEPDRWLVIGPDRAMNLLELVVLHAAEGNQLTSTPCH